MINFKSRGIIESKTNDSIVLSGYGQVCEIKVGDKAKELNVGDKVFIRGTLEGIDNSNGYYNATEITVLQ